jgi:hypothetical protein
MTEKKRKLNQVTRKNFISQLLLIELADELVFDRFDESSFFISYRDTETKTRYKYFPGVQKQHRLNDNTWFKVEHQEFIDNVRKKDLFGNLI